MSPTPRRRATLASLAAELKVSRTTISNAFNRPDQLSAELRERVLATAKRLGYGPDPVARSLRTRKAGAVGLVMTEPLTYSFSDPAARDFVAGVAESCEELGQGLLLVAVGPSRSLEEGTAAVLGAGVDGFVVYSAPTTIPTCRWCCSGGCRVVVVDQPKDLPGVSRVGIDDRAAMREIAEYVLGLGHREIGLLTMRLGRDRRQELVDAERLRSADLRRAARTHPRRLGRDGGRRCRPGFADRGGKLRAPADVGWRRGQGGDGGQSADHRADVHRRHVGPLGHGLPSGTWHLRARPDERHRVRRGARGDQPRADHGGAAEPARRAAGRASCCSRAVSARRSSCWTPS